MPDASDAEVRDGPDEPAESEAHADEGASAPPLERAARALAHSAASAERRPGVLGRLVRRLARIAPEQPAVDFQRSVLDAQHESLDRQGELLDRIHDLLGHATTVDGRLKQMEDRARQLAERVERLDQRGAEHRQLAIDAKHEMQQGLTRLEGSVAERLTRAEGHVGEQLTGLRARLDSEVTNAVNGLGDPLRAELLSIRERIEGIEAHLPDLTRDLSNDIGTMRASTLSQGRQLDDIAGELVAAALEIQEMRDETRVMERQFGELSDAVQRKLNPNAQFDHFDFARRYRGDADQIAKQLERYARIFGPVQRVLDFGCGRGEFLEVCRRLDIGAYGVDSDPEMISHCKLKDLEVACEDALVHLRKLDDRSLDGLFSAQVVEHLTPKELVEFVDLAGRKLKRGAIFIAETINPNTFSALRWYHLDPTHVQPVPPAMLRFFLEQQDFEVRDVIESSPVKDEERLQLLGSTSGADSQLTRALDANLERLNEVLFGFQDYAIVAER